MKKLILLLLWPLVAQAQVSTYSLSWDSVPVSPATSVIGYCSINDGTYFQAITVQTIQNTGDVIVDLKPGDKISCYAKSTDEVNYSPKSNSAVAFAPMQVSAQLCVTGGSGIWQVAQVWPGSTISPFYSLSAWQNNATLQQSFASMSTAFIKPGTVCNTAMVVMTPGREFHLATNASGITGLAICTMQ